MELTEKELLEKELRENAKKPRSPLLKYTCYGCDYNTDRKDHLAMHKESKKHIRLTTGIIYPALYKCAYEDCPYVGTMDSSNFGRHAMTHVKKRAKIVKKELKILLAKLERVKLKCEKNNVRAADDDLFKSLQNQHDRLKEVREQILLTNGFVDQQYQEMFSKQEQEEE